MWVDSRAALKPHKNERQKKKKKSSFVICADHVINPKRLIDGVKEIVIMQSRIPSGNNDSHAANSQNIVRTSNSNFAQGHAQTAQT